MSIPRAYRARQRAILARLQAIDTEFSALPIDLNLATPQLAKLIAGQTEYFGVTPGDKLAGVLSA